MPLQGRSSALAGFSAQRVEFNLDDFTRDITTHGYDVRWSKAALCPNRDPNQEDHHRINCELCDNAGFIYYDPVLTKALVTSYGLQQLFMPESRYQPGTAYFTLLPSLRLSFWDKVELLNAKVRYSQVIKSTSVLRYKLKYTALEMVRIITSTGATLDPSRYSVVGGDLVLSEPLGAAFFAAVYLYHPTYIILDPMHIVRSQRMTVLGADSEVEFPQQAMGRLDFLVRDEAASA